MRFVYFANVTKCAPFTFSTPFCDAFVKVIEEGKYTKSLSVEIYPIRLKLCNYSNKDASVVRKFSRTATIGLYF